MAHADLQFQVHQMLQQRCDADMVMPSTATANTAL